jgi:hypothetical protein
LAQGLTGGMEHLSSIVEHWTETRRGLVLAGRPAEIDAIARALRLPEDAAVRVSPAISMLALWGESLAAYNRTFALAPDPSNAIHLPDTGDTAPASH